MKDELEHWILDGHEPIPVDLLTWAKWFEKGDRVVQQDTVGRYWISTVFLGLDHRFGQPGPPLLFESMAFGDANERGYREDLDQNRYATWDEAVAGHEAMLAEWTRKHEEETK